MFFEDIPPRQLRSIGERVPSLHVENYHISILQAPQQCLMYPGSSTSTEGIPLICPGDRDSVLICAAPERRQRQSIGESTISPLHVEKTIISQYCKQQKNSNASRTLVAARQYQISNICTTPPPPPRSAGGAPPPGRVGSSRICPSEYFGMADPAHDDPFNDPWLLAQSAAPPPQSGTSSLFCFYYT